MFLALETLHANRADERPLWVVPLLVPIQMLLALEACATNVANKPEMEKDIKFSQVIFVTKSTAR
jgi:hypothetical protein